MLLVGYDDQKQLFIVRNSWGSDWGDGGYCYFPYAYLTDPELCTDIWTVRKGDNLQFNGR
jgi:C1A family cysteine protease